MVPLCLIPSSSCFWLESSHSQQWGGGGGPRSGGQLGQSAKTDGVPISALTNTNKTNTAERRMQYSELYSFSF